MIDDMRKIMALFLLALAAGACTTDFDYEDGIDDNNSEYANGLDSINGIDESMYAKARIFPGLVDTTREVRIDTVITLDLSKSYTTMRDMGLYSSFSNKKFSDVLPKPIYSTGVYAGAGELVNIILPDDAGYALTAQIGMQTDNVGTSSKLRQPVVYMQKQLRPGVNKLRFPLGGYIWLIRDTKAEGPADAKIRLSGGVYASHDYITGTTDAAAWLAQLKKSTVPWLDIRGRRVAFSVNRERIVALAEADAGFTKQLDRCLDFWDKAVEYHYRQLGLVQNDANLANRMPYFHDRFIFDVALYNDRLITNTSEEGLMMLQTSTFLDELMSWNHIKETSNSSIFYMIQDKYYTYYLPCPSEWRTPFYSVPFYRLYEAMFRNGDIEKMDELGLNVSTRCAEALAYAAADSVKQQGYEKWYPTNSVSTTDKYTLRMIQLAQLAKYNAKYHGGTDEGWSYLYDIAKASRLAREYTLSESQFFYSLCDYFKVNLTQYYDHWGIPVTDVARTYAERYPLLKDEIWKVDPLSKDDPFKDVGSVKERFLYRSNRTDWQILATSVADYGEPNEDEEYTKEDDYKTAQKLIDGSIGTYWASHLKKSVSDLQLPYYIIIDMGAARDLDGIYYGNGSSKCVAGFTVQTLDMQADLDLADTKTSAWKKWGTVTQTRQTAKLHEVFVPLQRRRTRYIRLVIDRENLYERPDETTDPDGAETFDKQNKKRYQRLAEFGTWHY